MDKGKLVTCILCGVELDTLEGGIQFLGIAQDYAGNLEVWICDPCVQTSDECPVCHKPYIKTKRAGRSTLYYHAHTSNACLVDHPDIQTDAEAWSVRHPSRQFEGEDLPPVYERWDE